MSKKNKTQNVTEEEVKTEETPIQTEQTETKKQQKPVTDNKKAPKKVKKEKKHLIRKKTKETVSELKKVTWPKFPYVVKKTGVVLVVVIIFALLLFGIDSLFGFLFGLLPKGIGG